MATCRSCGAEVEWCTTEANNRKMPLDLDPVKLKKDREEGDESILGNLVIIRRVAGDFGMTPVVRYVPAGQGTRTSHFATCPDRDEHRKKK
jgi:hypothetical protein